MRNWMKYIKPYKAWFILGPLCMIVEVIGEVLMPMLLARVINAGNMGTLTVGSSIGTAGLMILIAVFMMAGGIGGCYFSSKASIAISVPKPVSLLPVIFVTICTARSRDSLLAILTGFPPVPL